MKKMSKKKIAEVARIYGEEDIFKFFSERCLEATLDMMKCARGPAYASRRNLVISIATLMVWAPVALRAALGESGDMDEALEDAMEKMEAIISNEEQWLLEAYDNDSSGMYGD